MDLIKKYVQFLFLPAFIILTLHVAGQTSGDYIMTGCTECNGDCELQITRSGKFLLVFVLSAGENSDIAGTREVLSFGYCFEHRDSLFLTDATNFYTFIFVRTKEGDLKPVRGFPFMQNRTFSLNNISGAWNEPSGIIDAAFREDYPRKKVQKMYTFIQSGMLHTEVSPGTYYQRTRYPELHVDTLISYKNFRLLQNNTYQYSVNNMIISEGTWRVDGCFLILRDEPLKTNFLCIINSGSGFITDFIPGDFLNGEFKKR
ncbi:MAG: hypothetical protein NTX61_14135 [Bacteroidetes bacterium]|nr:hypothetical protein [Bacteroidota bacterium]